MGLDDAGMTDIPMRLMIAAVLTSLMVPIVLGAYEDLSCNVAQDRALREMERITRAARAVMDGDVGSTLELNVGLKGFGLASFKSAMIGGPVVGEPNATAYMITFDLEILGMMMTAPDPPIPMTGDDGSGGLKLSEGEWDLLVTHIIIGDVHAASFKKG